MRLSKEREGKRGEGTKDGTSAHVHAGEKEEHVVIPQRKVLPDWITRCEGVYTQSHARERPIRNLLVVVLLLLIGASLARIAPLHAARAASAEGRLERKVDVLLGLDPHEEGGHVHDLLSDADVPLADEHAGVVDGLGQAQLEDERLEPPLKHVLGRQGKDVIELVLTLVEEPEPVHSPHQSLRLEDALLIVLGQRKKLTRRLTELTQNHLDPPELALVAESILSHDLELAIEALLLERTARLLKGLANCATRKRRERASVGVPPKIVRSRI